MKTASEAAEQLCWTALRAFLTASAENKLREFAAQHPDETFYCLCVYFDGYYGDFFLYLNVPDQAKQIAAEIKARYPELHESESLDEVEQELKWNCGDFRYCLLDTPSDFARTWRPVADTLHSLISQLYKDAGDEVSEQFQRMWATTACLVALDLERSEVLGGLKKTSNFRVICVDHDETIEDSFLRLEGVRQNYRPLGK